MSLLRNFTPHKYSAGGSNTFNVAIPATAAGATIVVCFASSTNAFWNFDVPDFTDDQGNSYTLQQASIGYSLIFTCEGAIAGVTSIIIADSFIVCDVYVFELFPCTQTDAQETDYQSGTNDFPTAAGPTLTGVGGDNFFINCLGGINTTSGPGDQTISSVDSSWSLTAYAADQGTTDHTDGTGVGYFDGVGAQTPTFTFSRNVAQVGITGIVFESTGMGKIVVVKATQPSGSAQSFGFTTSYGSPFALLDGQSNDSGPLAPGTYLVTETPVAGWSTVASQDPTAIVVGSGTVTVTFTNTQSSPCLPVGGNGVFVSDLELFIGPATALYTSYVPTAQIAEFETTNEGRHAIVLDFNQGGGLYARDLGTTFSWPLNSGTVLYVWQPAIIPMPEGTYGRATDWIDGGTIGDKFVQGIEIEADSFNNPKTFFLQDSDTLTMHPVNETPATFNQQSIRAFSCSPPFVAHSVRVISTDGVEWRVWNTKLVFQPWPSQCKNWQTELTSLGMIGWGHVREMNIAYISNATVTLKLTFDAWPTITIVLPSTSGVQNKTKVTLPANKFKLIGLQASSNAVFRLFADDLQLKIKSWGSAEAYQVLRPFGGPSRTGAVV